MLNLSNLKPSLKAKKKKRTRLGRGNATGLGTYAGKGLKGQRSRSGGKKNLKRLGLRQMIMSTPKLRGFTSLVKDNVVVNVGDLEKSFSKGEQVTPKGLLKKGFIDNLSQPVKILGQGKLTKSLNISGCKVSKIAQEKITKAGGKIILPEKKR